MGAIGQHTLIDLPAYSAAAIYFVESDSVEYIRADVPCIYRRVDEMLTLILQIDTRDPIGFSLKGFRNFYLHHFKNSEDKSFISLVTVLEQAVRTVGDSVFQQSGRAQAYQQAIDIASQDQARLDEVPQVA